MGQNDREHANKESKRNKNKKQTPWNKNGGVDEPQSWRDVDALLIAYVVRAVGGAGGSAQFIQAQDGGALGVRVYHDDIKSATQWFRVNEDLEEKMYLIGDYYCELSGKESERWQ